MWADEARGKANCEGEGGRGALCTEYGVDGYEGGERDA